MLFLRPQEGISTNKPTETYINTACSMAKQILSMEHTNHLRLSRQKEMQHCNSGKCSFIEFSTFQAQYHPGPL